MSIPGKRNWPGASVRKYIYDTPAVMCAVRDRKSCGGRALPMWANETSFLSLSFHLPCEIMHALKVTYLSTGSARSFKMQKLRSQEASWQWLRSRDSNSQQLTATDSNRQLIILTGRKMNKGKYRKRIAHLTTHQKKIPDGLLCLKC